MPPAGEWTNRWVSVTDWFATNGTGRPSRHFEGDKAVYTLMTTNGPIVLRAGSQVATCNHLNCWLGYAPRFTNGELYLHPLDLQKNLLPAVRSSRMASAAGRVVVIDPGHGGDQPGTRSVAEPEGYEKNYTLDWARRLKPLLEQRGWRVILTRTNDVDVPLTNRVAMAERMKADLFISLHFNSAAPHAGQSGLETYCLTPAGLPSSLVRDYQDDARQVYPNNSHDLENYLYAVQLHRSLLEATGAADRGVRRARFMGVLRGQNRPAILIEGGFLSNPAEARLIARPEYRQKLADAVARALN
ncbi:MAG TPA: N-acetylmuramoyl-L-alanine amidase [Verrucomicrobiae bacterium]|nr:N-acetylmuramoyl-L-alanine amidase [Verrucomicrobiae bacterium]